MKKKTILLTGIAGFIGHHLMEHILVNTDWNIVGIARLSRAGDLNRLREQQWRFSDFDDRVKIVYHDLMFPMESVHKHIGDVDYIAHLAADSHVDDSIKNPTKVAGNNAMTTLHMLEYARVHQPKMEKFLYFSTDEVFGPAPDDYKFTEDDVLKPSNPYSGGKAAGEMFVTAYNVTYKMPTLITRTMNVFGERQDPEKFIPLIMSRLKTGKMIKVHGTKGDAGKRHYLHARNTADATLFLLQHEIVGEKVNVVGDKEVDNEEMVQLVGKAMGIDVKEGKHYEFEDFHKQRPGHDRRYAMSGDKLAGLGWTAPVDFETSLERLVKWTLERTQWLDL